MNFAKLWNLVCSEIIESLINSEIWEFAIDAFSTSDVEGTDENAKCERIWSEVKYSYHDL